MARSGSWKTAKFLGDTPQLLLKTRFDRTGYHVQLTDLSRIWEETLSKKEIINRAVRKGCSFNPGDDDDNYDAFLKYIQDALNGEARSTINLHTSDSGQLLLSLRTPLPGGLPALEWVIELVQLPEAAVAAEIVNPLLHQANSMRSQVEQLIAEITAKDHVIRKICDKLEAGGSDLTAIFPSISKVKTSGNRNKRSQLASHVAGLGLFDESAWRASNEKSHEGQELTSSAIDSVVSNLPVPESTEYTTDNWFENLTSTSNGSHGRAEVYLEAKSSSGNEEAFSHTERDTQEDDFQRQETPAQLSKNVAADKDTTSRETRSHIAQPAPSGDDSETETEDEDCLDIPPTTSQQHAVSTIESPADPREEHSTNTTRSEGASATTHTTHHMDPKEPVPQQPDVDTETEATASSPVLKPQAKHETHGSESEAEPVKPRRKAGLGKFGGAKAKSELQNAEPEEKPEPQPAKSKSGLGRLGGKKAQPSNTTPEPPPPTSKPKSTLGRFGGKAKKEEKEDEHPVASAKPSATPSRKLAPVVEQPPDRELTEEEREVRANEKRQKLKRELEAKAKEPAKKKRKF